MARAKKTQDVTERKQDVEVSDVSIPGGNALTAALDAEASNNPERDAQGGHGKTLFPAEAREDVFDEAVVTDEVVNPKVKNENTNDEEVTVVTEARRSHLNLVTSPSGELVRAEAIGDAGTVIKTHVVE